MISKKVPKWLFVAAGASVTGALAALLALLLKHGTEHYESLFLAKSHRNFTFALLLPVAGLALIHLLRQYAFRNRANKGITEVFDAMDSTKKLPSYKIPSHFVNGFLTVISGGSTGIEISTVVSAGAVGSVAHTKERALFRHKNALICAGIAAGITALFNSPLAGLLFVWEVVAQRAKTSVLLASVTATIVAYAIVLLAGETPLFHIGIQDWHWHALPYFVVLGVFAGLHSVYLTRSVLLLKRTLGKMPKNSHRILICGLAIGLMILLLPQLYGDGYHAMAETFSSANTTQASLPLTLTIAGLLLLKPVITAVTLSGGGDGGVFAPSLFAGAFLGLGCALVANTFFDAGVVPLNFMVAGMAALLSASIHAPLTALFAVCGITGNYALALPVCMACFVAKATAKLIFPYTVYSYPGKAKAA